MLTRDAFLTATPTFPREEVSLPELGGSVFVRVLTSRERDALEMEWEKTNRKNFRARLVLYAACDAEGRPLFQLQDLPAIGNQSAAVIQRITDVAFRLNKFTKEDREELEGNSEGTPADGS